jgi:hypothetical protein
MHQHRPRDDQQRPDEREPERERDERERERDERDDRERAPRASPRPRDGSRPACGYFPPSPPNLYAQVEEVSEGDGVEGLPRGPERERDERDDRVRPPAARREGAVRRQPRARGATRPSCMMYPYYRREHEAQIGVSPEISSNTRPKSAYRPRYPRTRAGPRRAAQCGPTRPCCEIFRFLLRDF